MNYLRLFTGKLFINNYFTYLLFSIFIIINLIECKLDCDPLNDGKKPDPDNPNSYLYCNLEGLYIKRNCTDGKIFNSETNECELSPESGISQLSHDDPILSPQFQAPEDICGQGLVLTRFSAPVVCNPSMNSCPDDYECTLYPPTGTSYCCQNPTEHFQSSSDITCSNNQITYYESLTGEPKTCVISSTLESTSCPIGFGCNLVGGTITRCCGKDFGCPYNSAGLLNPHTGGHVECRIGDINSCPDGFICTESTMFNGGICCSDTSSTINKNICGGDTPLASPNPCSSNNPCPNGYNCNNGRCCPSKGLCPVGSPLNNIETCSDNNPCPNNYQCVKTNNENYCCPAPEHVCNQPKDSGIICDNPQSLVRRYYFDESTGSCRSFKYHQCGGNANNFETLEQCEGFCVNSQCPKGQPYQSGSSNIACSPLTPSTCPNGYSCMQPLFGLNHICCSNEQLSCREPVSAGTNCFGNILTIERYYFNSDNGLCETFQYYGCHGSSNNFLTRQECEATCQLNLKNICNGVIPLMDPNNQPQRCSPKKPCSTGNHCNGLGYCCPSSEYACNAPKSLGNRCTLYHPDTYWFYDTMALECVPFTYNGCGGTVNKFSTKESCEKMCSNQIGECPNNMLSVELYNGGGPQRCSLKSIKSCTIGSCVLSTSNTPICCKKIDQCPFERSPLIVKGKVIKCQYGQDICPMGYECAQSINDENNFICCSGPNQLPLSSYKSKKSSIQYRPTKCPSGLDSNGQRCVVNAIGGCPKGYICLGVGSHGTCCRGIPKCTVPRYKPFYFTGKQVLVCGDDQIFCPDNTVCQESTIDGVEICCEVSKYSTYGSSSITSGLPRCRDQHIPFFEIGSREPKICDETSNIDECPDDYECSRASDNNYYCCPAWEKCPRGATPFLIEGTRKPLGCNLLANNCPEGYTCEGPKDRSVCCRGRPSNAQCPNGRKPFLYANRPLVCPKNSNKCPDGYLCLPSMKGNLNLCCSEEQDTITLQDCPNGAAYGNPFTHEKKICRINMNDCPTGYQCRRSQISNEFVCCSSNVQNPLESRYEGYCPIGQIPYLTVGASEPSTCHMALNPCPTTAPYQCIYSAEKQNSYCCTPTKTSSISNLPYVYHSRSPVQQGQQQKGNEIQQRPPIQQQTIYQQQQHSSSGSSLPSVVTGPNGEQINTAQIPIQLLSSATLPPALPGAPISGCPPTTQPLLNAETRSPHPCSTSSRCPDGFTCYSNYPDGRNAQCCTTMPTIEDDVTFSKAMKNGVNRDPIKMCPQGFIKIGETCKRMFYVGQPGCSVNEQCQSISNSTYCEKGYCRCPNKKLIYQSECVDSCPDGYVHIAGRCHDLTTIVFMDSVDERKNGTIGGYCLDTVIIEDQCIVKNSYCNERSIICLCKPGYELKMNFDDKTDNGNCIKVEDSKYDDENLLENLHNDDTEVINEISFDNLPEYYVIQYNDDGNNSTDSEMITNNDINAANILSNETYIEA